MLPLDSRNSFTQKKKPELQAETAGKGLLLANLFSYTALKKKRNIKFVEKRNFEPDVKHFPSLIGSRVLGFKHKQTWSIRHPCTHLLIPNNIPWNM